MKATGGSGIRSSDVFVGRRLTHLTTAGLRVPISNPVLKYDPIGYPISEQKPMQTPLDFIYRLQLKRNAFNQPSP